MFVYGPELLLVDADALSVLRVLVTASLGIIALVVAIQGWLFVRLGPGLRVIAVVISILLVVQSLWSDVLGIAAIAAFFTICRLRLLRTPAGSSAT